MTKWERIEDVLTPEGIDKLKPGQVLMFSYEGSPVHLKIRRKTQGKVWAERIRLFTTDEVENIGKGRNEDSKVR